MGKLREQMLREMKLRNFSPRTIQAYVYHVSAFARLFWKSPFCIGDSEVCKYLHYLLEEKGVSWSNINIAYCALRFFEVPPK